MFMFSGQTGEHGGGGVPTAAIPGKLLGLNLNPNRNPSLRQDGGIDEIRHR